MAIKIGSTTYAYLRDAINSAVSGDTILLDAGTYDIATTPNYSIGVPNASITSFNKFYGPSAYSLSRFFSSQAASATSLPSITGLTIAGDGASTTSITNLTRIYASNKDRGLGYPTSWTIRDLTLGFNLPFTGSGSGDYILQAGNFPKPGDAYGLDGAITDLTLRNLVFTGTHAGSAGSNGAYCVMVRADRLCLDNVKVETLTGQQGYQAGTATTKSVGGSAFLYAQGNGMKVMNSSFKEAGYANSLTIFDSSDFAVSGNIFDACTQMKERGQVFKSSTGSLASNTFTNGTFLDLFDVGTKVIRSTNNIFAGTAVSKGVGVRISDTPTISAAQSLVFTGNNFKDVVPFVSFIPEAATGPTGSTPQLSYGSNNVWNPASGTTGSYQVFNRVIVGSSASTATGFVNDRLSGANANNLATADFIIGGKGNDTISGNGGNDAFAFTDAPGTVNNNVDVITDFNSTNGEADKIWLDNAVFTPLARGALSTTNGWNTYITYKGFASNDPDRCSIFYDTQGFGRTQEVEGFVFKVAKLNGNSAANIYPYTPLQASDFVVF